MTPSEARAFEQDPLFDCVLKMRTWDEKAKIVGWVVPPLESYRLMIEEDVALALSEHVA